MEDRIKKMRRKLDKAIESSETDYEEILKISQELDVLIVEYTLSKMESQHIKDSK